MHNVSVSPRGRWAWAKIARAAEHIRSLESAIGIWAVAANYRPEASIADDRLSWELRARLDQPPALTEWSLMAGDALHNLRSALDVLVWAHADSSALTRSQQKDLGFPLERDASLWDGVATRRLRAVPDDVIDRIHQVQPFQRPPDEIDSDGLLLLHELDIADKHRLAVGASPALASVSLEHSVEFYDDAAAARNVPPDMTVHADKPLIDKVVILSGVTLDPIAKVKGTTNLTFRMTMETPRGGQPLLEGLSGLHQQVAATITFVDSGQLIPQPIDMTGPLTAG